MTGARGSSDCFGDAAVVAPEEGSPIGDDQDELRVTDADKDPREPHTALRGRPTRTGRSALSSREMEVAYLIAEGMTNAEIGGRLHISVWTVAHHISHIHDKLGSRRRAGIARWIGAREGSGDAPRGIPLL